MHWIDSYLLVRNPGAAEMPRPQPDREAHRGLVKKAAVSLAALKSMAGEWHQQDEIPEEIRLMVRGRPWILIRL
jgi:hypothetical protein